MVHEFMVLSLLLLAPIMVDCRTIYDLSAGTKYRSTWSFNDVKINITSRVIDCGISQLNQTIGLSFFNDYLLQFVVNHKRVDYNNNNYNIHVITYYNIRQRTIDTMIANSNETLKHFNLFNGLYYTLNEMDSKLDQHLKRFNQKYIDNMILVENSNSKLLAYFYHMDSQFDYGYYHYEKSAYNLISGDPKNCLLNTYCPSTFQRIILLNTNSEIYVLTMRVDLNSTKYSLQDYQLEQMIGYLCINNMKIELSIGSCNFLDHNDEIDDNREQNDQLLKFDYGFVHDQHLYLLSRSDDIVWEIDSKILEYYDQSFVIIIKKIDDLFICLNNYHDSIGYDFALPPPSGDNSSKNENQADFDSLLIASFVLIIILVIIIVSVSYYWKKTRTKWLLSSIIEKQRKNKTTLNEENNASKNINNDRLLVTSPSSPSSLSKQRLFRKINNSYLFTPTIRSACSQ